MCLHRGPGIKHRTDSSVRSTREGSAMPAGWRRWIYAGSRDFLEALDCGPASQCNPPTSLTYRAMRLLETLPDTAYPQTHLMPSPIRLSLSLMSAAALLSCTPSPVDVNVGVQAFNPPSEFRTWWAGVEDCSNETGDYDAVVWYLADDFAAGGTVVGQWSPPHSITLRRGFQTTEDVVKHEMLHDLLRGDRFHDELAWVRCRLPI